MIPAHLAGVIQQAESLAPLLPDMTTIDLLSYCESHTSAAGEPTALEYRLTNNPALYPAQLRDPLKAARYQLVRELGRQAGTLPWVLVDIDNTLVHPGGRVTPRVVAAVHRYIQAGGRVSLVSGKIPVSIAGLVAELGLEEMPHVTGNGAIVMTRGEYRQVSLLGPLATEIAAAVEPLGLPAYVYHADRIHFASTHARPEQLDYLVALSEPRPVQLEAIDGSNAVKLLLFVDEQDLVTEQQVIQRLKPFADRIAIIRTGEQLLEVVARQQSKGAAIITMMREHGWHHRHSLAAGDSQNDLSMLQVTGMPYLVANASQAMKAFGFTQIPSCQADGVAVLLEQVLAAGGVVQDGV